MPWSSQAVIAQTVIIEGPNDGLFVYSGTPAFGNLTASIANAIGTDQFGNAFLAGETSYDQIAGLAVSNNGAGLHGFTSGGNSAGPWTSIGTFDPVLPTGWESSVNLSAKNVNGGVKILLPSGDATGVTDTAALAAVLNAGSLPALATGTFNLNCGDATLSALGPDQFIAGSGMNSTFINAHGSGDLFGWSFSGAYSGRTTVGGGILGGLTIDMNGASATATAIHAGDIESLQFQEVFVINSGAGSSTQTGFHFDNRVHWTERMTGSIHTYNMGTAVIFDVSGALTSTNSYARLKMRCNITTVNASFNGVVVQNGAVIYDGALEIVGNWQSSSSALTGTPAVLTITGTIPAGHPAAGSSSAIRWSQLNIGAEVPSNTHAPQTVLFGSGSNVIGKCYGVMDFGAAGAFAVSNWSVNTGSFLGPIVGDTVLAGLCSLAQSIQLAAGLQLGNGTSQALANGTTITTAGLTEVLTSGVGAGVTGIIMQAGTVDGQVMVVINQSATGTITMAASGTSNVADGVSDVIAALTARTFVWSTGTSLWYRCS